MTVRFFAQPENHDTIVVQHFEGAFRHAAVDLCATCFPGTKREDLEAHFKGAMIPHPGIVRPQILLAFRGRLPAHERDLKAIDLKGTVSSLQTGPASFELENLCTSPDYRRRQVASALVWSLLWSLEKNLNPAMAGRATVTLTTDLDPLIYTRFGFGQTGSLNGKHLMARVISPSCPVICPPKLHLQEVVFK